MALKVERDNLPKITKGYLTHLTLGDSFNQEINNLPENILYLSFGNSFNQNIDNIWLKLSNNLTHLILGDSFNQNINKLPENITHLTLGYEFTQNININNQMLKLPNKLTNFIFRCYEAPIIIFPKSLTHITIK
jgi:hypothetical protein